MVWVINEGVRVYKRNCEYCRCFFAFNEEDITKKQLGPDYEDGEELSIKCPCCEEKLVIYKSNISYEPAKKEYEFPPQTMEAISGVSPV